MCLAVLVFKLKTFCEEDFLVGDVPHGIGEGGYFLKMISLWKKGTKGFLLVLRLVGHRDLMYYEKLLTRNVKQNGRKDDRCRDA